MFPPMSATNAPTLATMPDRSAHCRRSTARIGFTPASEEGEIRVGVVTQPRQVDFHARDPFALRVDASLRLDLLRDEHAECRRESGVAIEPLLIAQELLDARDLAHPLDLDDDRAAIVVLAQEIDRPDVGRILATHEGEPVAKRGD